MKKKKVKTGSPAAEVVDNYAQAIFDLRNKMTDEDFQDEMGRFRTLELAYVNATAGLKLSAGGSLAAALFTGIALRHAADICDIMKKDDMKFRRSIAFALLGAILKVAATDIDQMDDDELDGSVTFDELH